MRETKLEGLKVPYKIRKSEDASRARVDHKLGKFTIVLPEDYELKPEDILTRKKSWIKNKRKEFLQFKRKIPDRKFEEEAEFEILGDKKQIKIEKRRSNALEGDIRLAKHLVERTSVKDQLEKLLRNEAREVIHEKIEKYESKIETEPEKVYIRDQRTRWGSCSGKQNLSFNWRLVFAPEHVLEYVVAHELVHLEEKNHNEEFWKRVGEIFPDYRESNTWLKRNSSKLVFSEEDVIS